MKNTMYVEILMDVIKKVATQRNDVMLTPEHLLLVMFGEDNLINEINSFINVEEMRIELVLYLESLDKGKPTLKNSEMMDALLKNATKKAKKENVDLSGKHLFASFYELSDSFVQFILEETSEDKEEILAAIGRVEKMIEEQDPEDRNISFKIEAIPQKEEMENLAGALAGAVEQMKEEASVSHAPSKQNQKNNLVQILNNREIQPIIGRTDIIERTVQILARCNKNNPIHIGEPGVGKTAIVDGLTKLIDEGKVPEKLKNATVYSLNVGDLVAGTQYRGDLEARVKKLLQQLEKDENPILYIDEIHNIIGAGGTSQGTMDISNMLKPYLTNGKIKFIGATTEEEYKKVFSKDKALSRRFQTISVNEPTVDEAIQILMGLKEYYEKFHGISYTDEAIEAAVRLSDKYINEKYLPDKAIDLIDEAGAFISTYGEGDTVDKSLIEEVLSKVCKIPKTTVETDEISKLQTLNVEIKKNLYGQDKAVEDIVRAIKISRAGLMDDNKPIASMLMVGPTGVGKTELAKTLAKTMNIGFVKFDMSEYMDKTSVNKLIGANAGYVGYEEGGLLVDAIRKQPHCVLLLDEIEKAHPDVFNVLLQVMDDASLTDNQGRKADFRNVIILMTSNAGAKEVGKMAVGFGATSKDDSAMDEAVKKTFSPEFRNRLTGTVVFNAMDDEMAHMIAEKELDILSNKMPTVKLVFDTTAVDYISEKGLSDKQFGGRAIKRVIENELKPLFVDELLFGNLKNGGSCTVLVKDGEFVLKTRKKRESKTKTQ